MSDNTATLKTNDARGDARDGSVVRYEYAGDVVGGTHFLQEREDLLARGVVEGAGGFVAEEQVRIFGECAGDGHALLLATGKLGRKVCHALGEAHALKHVGGVERVFANLGRELDVFERSEVGHEVVKLEHEPDRIAAVFHQLALGCLGDVVASHAHHTRGGAVHAAQNVQGGSFARATLAQNDGELALLDRKRGSVQGVYLRRALAVRFVYFGKLEVGHSISCIGRAVEKRARLEPARRRYAAGARWGLGAGAAEAARSMSFKGRATFEYNGRRVRPGHMSSLFGKWHEPEKKPQATGSRRAT